MMSSTLKAVVFFTLALASAGQFLDARPARGLATCKAAAFTTGIQAAFASTLKECVAGATAAPMTKAPTAKPTTVTTVTVVTTVATVATVVINVTTVTTVTTVAPDSSATTNTTTTETTTTTVTTTTTTNTITTRNGTTTNTTTTTTTTTMSSTTTNTTTTETSTATNTTMTNTTTTTVAPDIRRLQHPTAGSTFGGSSESSKMARDASGSAMARHLADSCAACVDPNYTSTPACKAIPAGNSTAMCTRTAGDAMLTACLPSSFKLTCPKGNEGGAPDFDVAKGLTCKPCAGNFLKVMDRDPVKDKLWLSVSFGDLVGTNSAPVANVAHYEVWMVSAAGRPTSKVASIPAGASLGCCTEDRYQVSMRTTMKDYDGKSRLGVTAVSKSGNRLPLVAVSNEIVDQATGQVNTVQGSIALEMSSADAAMLVKDASSLAAAKAMLGKALADTIAGVDADDVNIIAIIVDGKRYARRLHAWERRLAAKVTIEYENVVAADKTITVADIPSAALATNIQKQSKSAGMPITVTKVVVAKPTVTTSSTGKEDPVELDSAASQLLFPCMAVMIAAGAQLSF